MNKFFWQDKKVSILGSTGFLGSHFVTELKEKGARVNPVSKEMADLLDFTQTKKVLEDTDVVVSCAALDGNAEFKKRHPALILDSNIRIVSNILNAAKELGIKDVVLISSAEIYSSYANNPVSEGDDYRIFGGHTGSGYILSKRYGEILSELYKEEFGIRVYLPRPSNVFGPGDHFGDQSTRVIPSIITKIVNGTPLDIWGDGSQLRQFIYAQDAVYTVLAMVEKGLEGKLNVSSNESISILSLAKKISSLMGLKPKIRLDKTKAIGSQNRILDTTKMYQLIDFTPQSLEAGLQKTISWYKENI